MTNSKGEACPQCGSTEQVTRFWQLPYSKHWHPEGSDCFDVGCIECDHIWHSTPSGPAVETAQPTGNPFDCLMPERKVADPAPSVEPQAPRESTSQHDHLRPDDFPRPARPVSVFYTRFRQSRAIPAGQALTFNEWMDFAEEWKEHSHVKD